MIEKTKIQCVACAGYGFHMSYTPADIRATRKALGLTQGEFGERVGMSYQMISCVERSMMEPNQRIIKYIDSVWRT